MGNFSLPLTLICQLDARARPWWMSLVISTMITVSDIVRRVTPPKKETEPRRAKAPGSIHAQYLCVCRGLVGFGFEPRHF